MYNSEEFISGLSDKDVLMDLLKADAILSFNEKGMVQLFNPAEGIIA
jgi:hypothetical protein